MDKEERIKALLQTLGLLAQFLTAGEFEAIKQALFDELGIIVGDEPELVELTLAPDPEENGDKE